MKEIMPLDNTPPQKKHFTGDHKLRQRKYIQRVQLLVHWSKSIQKYTDIIRSMQAYPEKAWHQDLLQKLRTLTNNLYQTTNEMFQEGYKDIYPPLYDRYVNAWTASKNLLNHLVKVTPRE